MNKGYLQNLPKHIAVIMDGNGRWAKKRFLPRSAGHRAGVRRVKDLVQQCAKLEIEALSVFAFSSENWLRPSKEVENLMSLLLSSLQTEAADLNKNNIRFKVIGNTQALSAELQRAINEVEYVTEDNTGLLFVVAINYGGKWDISQAAKEVARQVIEQEIGIDDIDDDCISDNLNSAILPPVDLFIRTSGEQRVSNFLLWQLAYAELYFTKVAWPAFSENEFTKALIEYARRQRRFGKTSAQIKA